MDFCTPCELPKVEEMMGSGPKEECWESRWTYKAEADGYLSVVAGDMLAVLYGPAPGDDNNHWEAYFYVRNTTTDTCGWVPTHIFQE
jgi:hypothetical protein